MEKAGTPLLMKAELLPGEKLLQSFGANALLPMYRDAGDTGQSLMCLALPRRGKCSACCTSPPTG